MILNAGIMKALKLQMTEGGSYSVHGSLTRGGYWLHECTDLWENSQNHDENLTAKVSTTAERPIWKQVFYKVSDTAVGDVYFPAPATYMNDNTDIFGNMHFLDSRKGFRE